MKAVSAMFNGRQALLGAFVAMALCIPFIYNNCSQARFGTLDSSSGSVVAVGQNTCGDNQVAVGTDLEGIVLCADLTQANGALCPAGSTLYEYDSENDVAHCLDNCQFPPSGDSILCSNGSSLSSIGANSAIICQPHPGANGISCSDTTDYLRGIDTSGSAVCEEITACAGVTPPVTPTINTVCPIPQELVNIVTDESGNVTPTCVDVDLSATDSLSCSTGQALVGTDASGAAVCQELFTPSTSDITCGAGEFLISSSSCDQLPVNNISHICPAGMYLLNTVGNTVNCEVLPNTTGDFNGTCPAGDHIIGYANGEPVCNTAPVTNNLGGFCPVGFYPNAINNNSLVCLPYESHTPGCANGPQQICHVGSSTGEPQTGTGVQLCDTNTNQYGNCEAEPGSQALNCFNGYEQNGIQYCDPVDPNSCNASSFQNVLCPITNGTGQITCDNGGRSPCTIIDCNSGYLLNAAGTACEPTECVPGTVSSCDIANGSGSSTCSASGTPGSCELVSCDSGYTSNAAGIACIDDEDPVASFSSTPSNPTTDRSGNASFNLTDNVGIKDYRYLVPGAAWTSFTAVSGNPKSFSGSLSSSDLSPGTHKIRVQVRDTSNKNNIADYSWVIQLCAPKSVMSPSTCTIANATTTSQTCNAAGSAYDACTVVTCGTSDGVVYAPNSANTACVASSCTTPGHTNVNGVCGDNQNPVVTLNSTPSNPTTNTTGNVGFNITDNVGVKDFRVKLPGGSFGSWSAIAGSPASYAGSVNTGDLSPGTYTITVEGRDTSNKVHSESYTWTIHACSPNSVLSQSACTIANASSTAQTCSADGSAYGSCSVVTCASGYTVNAAKTACTDNAKPVATFTSTPSNPTIETNASLGFSGTDNVGINGYRTRLPGALWTGWAPVSGNPTNFTASVNTSDLSVGTHTAYLQVRDTSNQIGIASYTWVVRECSPGTAAVACSPGLANASGTKTCSASGSYGSCTPSCNAGFLMVAGVCQKVICGQNGSTTQSCSGPISNASYSQTCNSTGTALGSCDFVSCNAGHVKVGSQCLPAICSPNKVNTSGCPVITNGVNSRVCNATGTGYGACTFSCSAGYTKEGNACIKSCGANEVAVGNKSCECKTGYAGGTGNTCLPVACDATKPNPQSCATPSYDANSTYGFNCGANGTVKGACEYISCDSGYKRVGNRCETVCSSTQVLINGTCKEKYIKASGSNGSLSYAAACARVSGYRPIATYNFPVPSGSSEDRGQPTDTAGPRTQICISDETVG